MIIYKDRCEAGKKLAEHLEQYRSLNPLILAMPRGGVVVGYEVAEKLHAQLDVIVARKLGAPNHPEYAIGAIAPGEVVVLNPDVDSYFKITDTLFQNLVKQESVEMQRRVNLYRGKNQELDVKNKVVIIVDDGVATGQSAIAAIRSVRKLQPAKIIFAVPVGAADAIEILKKEADIVICLEIPVTFYAVGSWYEKFNQTQDAEVIELLEKNRKKL